MGPRTVPAPLAGALNRRFHVWLAHCKNAWILRVVRDGYRIPWAVGPPPLSKDPLNKNPPKDQQQRHIVQCEINNLLRKGTIITSDATSPGFYSRLFMVPKKSGELRPILDLSALNKFISKSKFKMETPRDIRRVIRHGDWGTSLDLQDAYYHILIHPDSRKFLRFVWADRVYEYAALPFGLSPAPLIFTKVAVEFLALQRRAGHRLKAYLDDWLVLSSTNQGAHHSIHHLMSSAQQFGFQVNLEKSELVPSQTFIFLGMAFDTVSFTVRPAPPRIKVLSRYVSSILQGTYISFRDCHRVIGHMESVSDLLPLARVHKRPFQRQVANRFPPLLDWDCEIPSRLWLRQSLSQWLDTDWLHSHVPIRPIGPRVYLHTDASLQGWGAHCDQGQVSGSWDPLCRSQHINWLELQAIFLALQHFQSFLRNKCIVICSDNTTALAYIRAQGGTASPTLSLLAESVLLWAHSHGMTLIPEFVPGKLNVLADALSRSSSLLPTECTIARSALQPVWSLWGKPHIDLFATHFSARLPTYISPFHDTQAFAKNAFSLSWEGMNAYAYPATPLISRVIEKFLLERPRLVLVTPAWPSRPWFPELTTLSHVPPFPLSLSRQTLLQPRTGIGHQIQTCFPFTPGYFAKRVALTAPKTSGY